MTTLSLTRATSLKTLAKDKRPVRDVQAVRPIKREFKINHTPKHSNPYLLDQIVKGKVDEPSNLFLESRPKLSLPKPTFEDAPLTTSRLDRVLSTKQSVQTIKSVQSDSNLRKEFFKLERISLADTEVLKAENHKSTTNLPRISFEKIDFTPTQSPSKKKHADELGKTPNSMGRKFDSSAVKIYLLNKQKYMPKNSSFGYPSSPKKTANHDDDSFNLNRLKEELKVRVKRQNTKASTADMITKQKIKAMQELQAEMQKPVVSKDYETRIAILKKKIAINTMLSVEFKADNLSVEEKKTIYKNLLLEYHPDKRKYEKEVSEEILNYLLMNKNLFIEGTKSFSAGNI